MSNLDRIGRGAGRSPDEVMSDVMNGSQNDAQSTSDNRNNNALGHNHDYINDYIQQRRGNSSSQQNDNNDQDMDLNDPIDQDADQDADQDDDPQDPPTDNTPDSPNPHHSNGSSSDRGITFFQRIILMGLAFAIIATVGKYAWDSLWFVDKEQDFKTNMQKISIDTKENLDKIMGKGVVDSENKAKDFLEDMFSSAIMETVITSYTMDEFGTISFKYGNLDETVDISTYPDLTFSMSGGYIELEIFYDNDGNVINYKITKSGGTLDASTD